MNNTKSQETAKHTLDKWKLHAKIADRVQFELTESIDRVSLMMDLESVPDLDCEGLLNSKPFDFSHDIYGIVRHMDRTTYPGKLQNCFVPRYARKAGAK